MNLSSGAPTSLTRTSARHRNLPITFPRVVADESVFWSTHVPDSHLSPSPKPPHYLPRVVADESVFWSTHVPTSYRAHPPEQLHCSLFTIHSITNPPPQSDIHLPLSPLTSLVLSEYRPHGQNPSAYSKALKC